MHIASFLHEQRPGWGIVTERGIIVAERHGLPPSLIELLGDASAQVPHLLSELRAQTPSLRLDEVQLLAPIPRPRKNIICLGLNYLAHAQESLAAKGAAMQINEDPVVFTKNVTAVTGPYADVMRDPRVTEQLDWEAELAVVIGRGGRFIEPAEALQHVFGYTVLNDLSARDLQFRHKQYFLGKSLDGGCPMGPWIVTADEIPDPQTLNIACRVNGVVKQHANTSQQRFDVATTIAILSRIMTLEPGDIIATGTPEGVGFARKPPEFLRPGDVVECEIERIGSIRNRIIGPRESA